MAERERERERVEAVIVGLSLFFLFPVFMLPSFTPLAAILERWCKKKRSIREKLTLCPISGKEKTSER